MGPTGRLATVITSTTVQDRPVGTVKVMGPAASSCFTTR